MSGTEPLLEEEADTMETVMITPYEIIVRLLLGTVLGGIIGFERQTHGRPAGFRTQLLVCVACTLLMVISDSYYMSAGHLSPVVRLDPLRIAAGAMTGVGFLGAGVILKSGLAVQGLTTAACIWIVAAIGIAVGAGQYLAGVLGCAITFFSLYVLRIWEAKIPRLVYNYFRIVTDETGDEDAITAFFREKGCRLSKMEYEIRFPEKEKVFAFTISIRDGLPMKEVLDSVSHLGFVKRLEIKS